MLSGSKKEVKESTNIIIPIEEKKTDQELVIDEAAWGGDDDIDLDDELIDG